MVSNIDQQFCILFSAVHFSKKPAVLLLEQIVMCLVFILQHRFLFTALYLGSFCGNLIHKF